MKEFLKSFTKIAKKTGDFLSKIGAWIEKMTDINPELMKDFLITLIIILFLYFLRKVVLRIAFRRIKDVRIQYQWRKVSTYVSVLFGIILIGRVWFEAFQSLATFLGLLSAGLAIALRDPVANFGGWIFILWRRPFEAGDRIQIGDFAGDVIDIRIFQFTLMEIGNWVDADQSTGRVIHIPNGKVFTEMLANYSKGFQYIWNEMPVLITFESNWRRAKEILLAIANKEAEFLTQSAERRIKRAAKKFLLFYSILTPIVYTSVKECGVLLTIRYLCEPRKRRSTEHEIWEDILVEFAKCEDIDFAYPTQRFYSNIHEGKPLTRPPDLGKK
ncbi:MAG: mechanosensitive ion channel [Deltaproteobacteria bacterium]|uniref:Mechanosensitive ion channel n=1 Tax=Candidatus Zymogenus saltonus TaxID=2844893 RepID=A0A9D8KEI7_9DELT|nr:mechanosensitive ion channel [Candidatus Zymogenus saltonus]